MTAATNSNDIADVSLATPLKSTEQMEKSENGTAVSRLPKPLAIEVYSKVHNSNLSEDDLLDEIEDLIDEKFFAGEKLMSSGKEYTVVSSEKRGGLTLYTMEDGTKIGHRDLRRKKGLSVEEIKKIAIEDAEFVDEKQWKVREELLAENPIREIKKYAPIFSANRKSTPKTAQLSVAAEADDSDVQEVSMDAESGAEAANKSAMKTPRGAPRASGGPVILSSRRLQEKQKEKDEKEKEKLEKKQKEQEEKKQKKEEEKAKKLKEKEEKLKEKEEKAARKAEKKEKNNGTMDKFLKKDTGSPSSKNAPLFSPSKWGEKRIAVGVKKMEDAWKRRDLELYNEACSWCEKNLSGNQRSTFENPIFKFSVQKLVDKAKDRAHMKGMKWAQKAEFKAEMSEKRKELYQQFEPKIKAWFNEDIALDDLLVTCENLELLDAKRVNCDEELLKCLEISQFFVSMRKILLWNENITAEQLRDDLHGGFDGFKRSTYKMIANLLETALQEKEHEKAAHCNARLSEFPINEHTISELIRAFFIGSTETSFKRDGKRAARGAHDDDDEEDGDEEEMDSREKVVEIEEKPEKNVENGAAENGEIGDDEEENSESELQKQRILALFADSCHIYELPAGAQLEVLCAMKEVVHGLPIIREWFLRDANSEKLTEHKKEANRIRNEMEQFHQQLQDFPPIPEITESMTRTQTREAEQSLRRREKLENQLDTLKIELEENREATAREADDLERIFRVVHIGNDRHLRKYYWFAYSSDAAIWVQDFGTTSYEKWVRDCSEKGFMDVESSDVENRPEYEDLPLTSSQSSETWYKLDTEPAIRQLMTQLKTNGKREKLLKKYLRNNMDDIISSILRKEKKQKKDDGEEEDEEASEEDEASAAAENGEEKMETEQNETAAAAAAAAETQEAEKNARRFTGRFGSLKRTMSELLNDWKQSGISKIVDSQVFEARMLEANTLDEMKRLCTELVTSIPVECVIEKFPQNVAIAKKCFSHLKMPRFCRRVQEASNASCLHMLLAYFDARIDQQRTLPELSCQVCRRKTGTERKLMCKQCSTVFHYGCHRPTISRALFEEEGFKEGWWCAKCTKEDRRRQLSEAKEDLRQKEEGGGDEEDHHGSGESDDEDEEDIVEEETRGRSAKRKANAAMRDVLEFEGVLRQTPAPPPPKRQKTVVVPEVLELFNSIERANPRLYKTLQQIPGQSRSTRNAQHENRSLPDIEQDLDVYTSAEQLHEHLSQFFRHARGYIETHNPRKLDDLDELISELNFM